MVLYRWACVRTQTFEKGGATLRDFIKEVRILRKSWFWGQFPVKKMYDFENSPQFIYDNEKDIFTLDVVVCPNSLLKNTSGRDIKTGWWNYWRSM